MQETVRKNFYINYVYFICKEKYFLIYAKCAKQDFCMKIFLFIKENKERVFHLTFNTYEV